MWSCPIPPFREQEGITIVFRDLTNHSLSIRACSATSLFSLAVAYETLTDRPRGLLTFKMPNGATYTVQSPGMGLQIRDVSFRRSHLKAVTDLWCSLDCVAKVLFL